MSDTNRKKLDRLNKGYIGERTVVEFIEKYGHPEWKILQNIWLDENSPYETDILIIGKMGWLVLEVKNYEGHFCYENGLCYLNNYIMSNNIISQAQKILVNNFYLNRRLKLNTNVRGVLVFIGEHNEVDIKERPDQLEIIHRHQLKKYILDAAKEKKYLSNQYSDSVLKSVSSINNLEIPTPFKVPVLNKQTYLELTKGIQCSSCHSFNLHRTLRAFHCDCGYSEGFRDASLVP